LQIFVWAVVVLVLSKLFLLYGKLFAGCCCCCWISLLDVNVLSILLGVDEADGSDSDEEYLGLSLNCEKKKI
jgi:hypothetical protein